jgi:hypothetical protein
MTTSLNEQGAETPPSLKFWGEFAPIVAKIVKLQPSLGQRIVLAPRHVLHALGAYVGYGRANDHDIGSLAQGIAERDIRKLLSDAVLNPHPRLFRTLAKIGLPVQELGYYRDLNDALNGPASSILLRADRIPRDLLSVVLEIAQDPVLIAASDAIADNKNSLRNLRSILCFLRSLGVANQIENLPAGSGWNAIVRRIKADMEHARAPAAPFLPPLGWSVIEDVGRLWKVGERMQNCVSPFAFEGERHLRDFLSGQAAFLVSYENDGVMLAEVQRVGPRLWTIEEFAAVECELGEKQARQKFGELLTKALFVADQMLIEADPIQAMGLVSRRRQHAQPFKLVDALDSLTINPR